MQGLLNSVLCPFPPLETFVSLSFPCFPLASWELSVAVCSIAVYVLLPNALTFPTAADGLTTIVKEKQYQVSEQASGIN